MHKMKKISVLFMFVVAFLSVSRGASAQDVEQKKNTDKTVVTSAPEAEFIVFSVKVPKSVASAGPKTSKAAKSKTAEKKAAVDQQAIEQQMAECKNELNEIVKNAEDTLKKTSEEEKLKENREEVAKYLNEADMLSIGGKPNEAKKKYEAAMAAASTPELKAIAKKRRSAAEERIKQIELKDRKAAQEAAAKAKLEAKKKADEEKAAKKAKEELARKKAEEEKAAKRAGQEMAKKKAEEEKAAKNAEKELVKKRAEEERAAQKAKEELARKKAEEERAAKRAAEEIARKKADEEKAAKKAREELARKKAEEERAAKRAEENVAKKKSEEERSAKKTEKELVRKKAEEEKAAMKAAEEKLAAAKAQTLSDAATKETAEKVDSSATDKIIASIPQTQAVTVQAPAGYDVPAPIQPPAAGEEISVMYKEAVALYWDGKYNEAKAKFEQVQKASPEYARTNYYLGRAKEKLSK